jgi:hypothetical protein
VAFDLGSGSSWRNEFGGTMMRAGAEEHSLYW